MGAINLAALLPGREEIHLKLELDKDERIISFSLSGIGPLSLLTLLEIWRAKLVGRIGDVPLPEGRTTGDLLLREVLLKAQGRWNPPHHEQTLCYCRTVATATVDQAILAGALTPERVSELTLASTGCGTCRPDVQGLIDYRLSGENRESKKRAA